MNERIRELAAQADPYLYDRFDADDINELLETFAELLIQEVCWDMINSHLDKTKVNRLAKSWGVDIGVEE